MPPKSYIVPCILGFILLASAIALAEYARRTATAIPDAMLFGTFMLSAIISLIAFIRARAFQTRTSPHRRWATLYMGIAVVLAVLPMGLLDGRYRGDYDATRGRTAPDGAAVTSVSWREQSGGRYIERINDRFDRELTEAEYREIMRNHQRAFLGGMITFSSLALWTSLAVLLLARRAGSIDPER